MIVTQIDGMGKSIRIAGTLVEYSGDSVLERDYIVKVHKINPEWQIAGLAYADAGGVLKLNAIDEEELLVFLSDLSIKKKRSVGASGPNWGEHADYPRLVEIKGEVVYGKHHMNWLDDPLILKVSRIYPEVKHSLIKRVLLEPITYALKYYDKEEQIAVLKFDPEIASKPKTPSESFHAGSPAMDLPDFLTEHLPEWIKKKTK